MVPIRSHPDENRAYDFTDGTFGPVAPYSPILYLI
jgi:hypothetical protein